MKPCRITGRVLCKQKAKCPSGLARVEPQCALCFDATLEILDLEGNVLCELKNLPAVRQSPKAKAEPKSKIKAKER